MSIFLARPPRMSTNARDESTACGFLGEVSCGRNSRALAMGPASRYGKKATYTAKSSAGAGASWPR